MWRAEQGEKEALDSERDACARGITPHAARTGDGAFNASCALPPRLLAHSSLCVCVWHHYDYYSRHAEAQQLVVLREHVAGAAAEVERDARLVGACVACVRARRCVCV